MFMKDEDQNGDGQNGDDQNSTIHGAPVNYGGINAAAKSENDPFKNLTTAADQLDFTSNSGKAEKSVRLRGLPFSATDNDVREFFASESSLSLCFVAEYSIIF